MNYSILKNKTTFKSITTMLNTSTISLPNRLSILLKGKTFKNHTIAAGVVDLLKKQTETSIATDLLLYLKHYLSLVVNDYNKDHIVKKIVEIVFEELIIAAGPDIYAFQTFYGVFNLLSVQKLSKNPQILKNFYESLTLKDQQNRSGLFLILTTHKTKLLEMLIILAKDNPTHIKDIYTSLSIRTKNGNSALHILHKEHYIKNFNQIKNLLKPSFYLSFFSIFLSKHKAILKELNEIQLHCLNCLDHKNKHLDQPINPLDRLEYLHQEPSDITVAPEESGLENKTLSTTSIEKQLSYLSLTKIPHVNSQSFSSNSPPIMSGFTEAVASASTLGNPSTFFAQFPRIIEVTDNPTLIQTSSSFVESEHPSLPGTPSASTQTSPEQSPSNSQRLSPSKQMHNHLLFKVGP